MPNDPSTQPEGASRSVLRRFSSRERLRILEGASRSPAPGSLGMPLVLRQEGHVPATWVTESSKHMGDRKETCAVSERHHLVKLVREGS